MKLTIIRNPRQSRVVDEENNEIAIIKNKLLSMDKTVVNTKDKEIVYTAVSNGEDCYVFDEDREEIAFGIIQSSEKSDFKNSFFDNPDEVTIEFGEDAYKVTKERRDTLKITKQEMDSNFFTEVAFVRDVSKVRSTVETDVPMSYTTLIVIYIFAKYLYDSKLTAMV